MHSYRAKRHKKSSAFNCTSDTREDHLSICAAGVAANMSTGTLHSDNNVLLVDDHAAEIGPCTQKLLATSC